MKKVVFSLALCSFVFGKSYVYVNDNDYVFFDDAAIYSIFKSPKKYDFINKFEFPKLKTQVSENYDNLSNDKLILDLLKQNAISLDFDISEYNDGIIYSNFIQPYTNKECIEANELSKSKSLESESMDSWYCINSTALMYHNGDLSSFCGVYSEYLGGAHPNTTIECKNYIQNQKLELADFIQDMQAFEDIVMKKLQKATKDDILPNDYDGSHSITNSIYFDKNGIVLVYSPYEIAPYSFGSFSLFIDKDELKGVLKEEFFNYFK